MRKGFYKHTGFKSYRDCAIYVAKTKELISCPVSAQLVCTFVFAYAKSRFSHDAANKEFYNATIQNNRESDRVHNYELYTATVNIKHKSVDRIKTVLRFWLNATR